VMPTLDAGTRDLYRRINRPHPSVPFRDHVRGLAEFRQEYSGYILLELMLLEGLNDSEEALTDIASCVERIAPDELHISLPERPPAEPWVRPADSEGVARAVAILGNAATVLHPGETVLVLDDADGALEAILRVIHRHPLSADQLDRALAGHPPAVRAEILGALESCGKARPVRRHGSLFWVSSQARFPDEEKKR
jgi:wyosine [tRNA(Phe)-imidazoG37] synthetase (radical SAM superfamily)